MLPFLAPLFGAVASSIFGASQKKDDRSYQTSINTENRHYANEDYSRNRADYLSDRAHNEAREDAFNSQNQIAKLRDDALAAGINPLTALGAGGLSGPVAPSGSFGPASAGGVTAYAAPPLSSSSFVAQSLGQGVETLFNKDRIASDMEADAIRIELAKEELLQLKKSNEQAGARASFGYSIPQVVENSQDASMIPTLASRPKARPNMQNLERIPMFLPDGQQRMVLKSPVERLGMKPWDTISSGDYAELVGEARGEVEAVLMADKIGHSIGITLDGRPSKYEHPVLHDARQKASQKRAKPKYSPSLGSKGRKK
jgi:hypothetical protein